MQNNVLIAKITENNIINIDGSAVSDSVQFIKIKFFLPESWKGLVVTALFKHGNSKYFVLLNGDSELCTGENECYIPSEVIKTPGFEVSAFGDKENTRATA